MSDIDITYLTKSILNDIYAEYLERIKDGVYPQQANSFAYRFDKKCKSLAALPESDVDMALEELKEIGFIKYTNILGDFKLTHPAISYMENHFAKSIKRAADAVTKLIP